MEPQELLKKVNRDAWIEIIWTLAFMFNAVMLANETGTFARLVYAATLVLLGWHLQQAITYLQFCSHMEASIAEGSPGPDSTK
jgi:hypothetical protein